MLEGLSTSHLVKIIKMTPPVHRQDPKTPQSLKSKNKIIKELFCFAEQENPPQDSNSG